jgi:phosphate-selective porin
MAKEIRSGNFKITVALDKSLRDDYLKVCESVINKSMAQDIRDFVQAQVKKFKKLIPDEPKTEA